MCAPPILTSSYLQEAALSRRALVVRKPRAQGLWCYVTCMVACQFAGVPDAECKVACGIACNYPVVVTTGTILA